MGSGNTGNFPGSFPEDFPGRFLSPERSSVWQTAVSDQDCALHRVRSKWAARQWWCVHARAFLVSTPLFERGVREWASEEKENSAGREPEIGSSAGWSACGGI